MEEGLNQSTQPVATAQPVQPTQPVAAQPTQPTSNSPPANMDSDTQKPVKKSKRLYVIIGIVFIVLIILGALFLFLQGSKVFSSNVPKEIQDCRDLRASFNLEANCMSDFALSQGDSKVCEHIGNQIGLMDCIQRIEKNPELCEEEKEGDKKYCYSSAAKYLLDEKICDKTDSYKRVCYTDVAVVKKDPALCMGLDILQKPSCLSQVAFAKKDKSICEMIEESDSQKMDCLSDIIIEEKSWEECFDLDDSHGRDECFSSFATDTTNWSLCQEIKSNFSQGLCIEEIALLLGNSSLCEITRGDGYGYSISNCYYTLAFNQSDANLCEKIIYPDDKNRCSGGLLNDPSFCNKIVEDSDRDGCLFGIAWRLKDKSICPESSKESCEKAIDEADK